LDEKNLHRKKPMMRQGGILGCGGKEIDAIKYYSERIQVLCAKIDKARSEMSSCKATSYGWIAYEHVAWAHANMQRLASSSSPLLTGLPKLLKDGPTPRVELAPQPKDIIWSNVGLNEHIRNSKHLVASCVFYVFVFLWFIPSSVLSASSNVQSFLGLFPNSTQFIHDHSTFVSLLSSWFTPLFMATFFYILPKVLRRISQHQGYLTGTSLDRQVLAKLFLFFIVNNLFVFTVSSTCIAMYGQIHKAVESRTSLTVYQFLSTMTHKLSQVTKNLSGNASFYFVY
jgi:hypothetical protein